MSKGKTPAIYDYYEQQRYVMTGSIEEICKHLGISRQSLWNRVLRCKNNIEKGIKVRKFYSLEKAKESVNEYVLFIDDNFVGKGTINYLSELTGYTRGYLDQHINGYYKSHGYKKKHPIEIFKRVG